MADKKTKIKKLVTTTSKTARNLLDNAIISIDQNNDGQFNISDITILAESVGEVTKKGTKIAKVNFQEKAKALEFKALQPIFPNDLNRSDFLLSKFIRIVERSKKYIDNEVCRGSIGHISNQRGLYTVNIFRDSINLFGLSFFPDYDCEFYYIDPSDKNKYIALDDYFNYLKIARINELQKIAQDLGAKRFKITYKEEQTYFTEKKIKSNIRASVYASADLARDTLKTSFSNINVEAENEFPGGSPLKPQLKYMQKDPNILNLIAMRMDKKSPLTHQKFMLKFSNTSGMKETDAIKIDAVLKELKYSGNTTVTSELKNESRKYFEYDIEF